MSAKMFLALLLLFACKQLFEVKTFNSDYDYEVLVTEHNFYFSSDVQAIIINLMELIAYEERLTTALDGSTIFTPEQRKVLAKIQHKVRSFLTYVAVSRCLEQPQSPTMPQQKHSPPRPLPPPDIRKWEKNWLDRYDINYYERGKDSYEHVLKVDENRLCYIFLSTLKELTPEQIDLKQSNADFFLPALRSDKGKKIFVCIHS